MPKQEIAVSLNVDGRELAAVYGFAAGAPSPDGGDGFFNSDHNYSNV
jgi:hypothetical protein